MSSTELPRDFAADRKVADEGNVLAVVAEAAGRLRFGAIQLTIHNGKIVQLDVTERQRFT